MGDVQALHESLYTLYAKIAALKTIAGPELLLLGRTNYTVKRWKMPI